MRTFTDGAGRTWKLPLDRKAVQRIAATTSVAFDELRTPEDWLELKTSQGVEVLFAVVWPQARKAGVSPEEFGGEIGETVYDGIEQLMLAWRDAGELKRMWLRRQAAK